MSSDSAFRRFDRNLDLKCQRVLTVGRVDRFKTQELCAELHVETRGTVFGLEVELNASKNYKYSRLPWENEHMSNVDPI